LYQYLKESDAGIKVEDICRKHGKELQEENNKLKQMFADVSLENRRLDNISINYIIDIANAFKIVCKELTNS